MVLAGVAVVATLSYAAGSRFGKQNSTPLQTSPTSIQFVANNVMNFDGRTRIVTKLKSFYPCTLECWCRIEEYDSKVSPQAIIGSDIPTKHGLSMGISTHVPFADTVDQTFFAPMSVPIKSWIHLAVVFSESETRIYLEGKHCMVGPPTKSLGDIDFVHRKHWTRQSPLLFQWASTKRQDFPWRGIHRRLSPDEDLRAKEATELLYTIKSIDGDAAKDLSGKGNDGKVERKEI